MFTIIFMLFVYVHRSLLKATVILSPLLGITWVFGLLAVNQETIVFAWIFTILNSLQVKSYVLCTYIAMHVVRISI